jgi:translation initiation factor 5B
MAPKKGNKKGNDDWEAELGESIAPADSQPVNGENGDADPAEAEEDGENAGGLMAMLKKRKERRKQKGLPEEEGAETVGEPQLATAQEVNADDEFALPDKKGKGGKGKQQNQKKAADEDDGDNGGKILTKAEKEKLKKEREKQRKKEQVRFSFSSSSFVFLCCSVRRFHIKY